eukprot:sb/3476620/
MFQIQLLDGTPGGLSTWSKTPKQSSLFALLHRTNPIPPLANEFEDRHSFPHRPIRERVGQAKDYVGAVSSVSASQLQTFSTPLARLTPKTTQSWANSISFSHTRSPSKEPTHLTK